MAATPHSFRYLIQEDGKKLCPMSLIVVIALVDDYELRGNKMMIGGIELQEQPGTAKTV
jgi:hypothetical protein